MNINNEINLRQEQKEAIDFYESLSPSARTPAMTRLYRVIKLSYDLGEK